MPRLLRRHDAQAVTQVAAPINRRVAVQQLAPLARVRQADPVCSRGTGVRFAMTTNSWKCSRPAAGKTTRCSGGPRRQSNESHQVEVRLPERRLAPGTAVQVLDKPLQAAMIRAGLEQLPVQFAVGVPLGGLAEFAAHEQKLLAGEHPLVAQQRPQVREPLPVIARHPAQQRAFAVHDLIVGERQDEVLVMVIEHREGEFVLMILAMNRVVAEVRSVSCIQPMFHLNENPSPPK